jgi:hypothetical protein
VLNGGTTDLAIYIAQPTLVSKLNREELGALLAQIKMLEGVVMARLLASIPDPADSAETCDDRLLDVKEAAARLAVTEDFLYRRKGLPFRVNVGPGQARFSAKGIERWIRAKTVKACCLKCLLTVWTT